VRCHRITERKEETKANVAMEYFFPKSDGGEYYVFSGLPTAPSPFHKEYF
jgi:hypothetical protein